MGFFFFLQKPKEVEDEEKRERKDDEGAEEENAEELEMKDALFGDENMEPPGKGIFIYAYLANFRVSPSH